MTLHQLLLILWARRKPALAVLGLTVLAALVVSLLLPKQYKASTAVVVDVKSPDPIVGMVLPGMMAPGYMATQVDIVNSDRTAQRVVKLLRMGESPAIQEQWLEATEGKGEITHWLAELLQKKLDVKPSRESNVINIGFTGQEPAFTAAVANAFAHAYIDTTIELRVEPARQYAVWFDSQVKAQRERLEAAQKALSDFQQESGIIATDERLDYEMQKYNELSSQLTQAESQGADSASKQKFGSSDTLHEVMTNPLVNQLKGDVARLESRLKELAGNLGENHPQYQRTLAEVNELKARLKSETAKVTSAIGTAGRVSQAKEHELQAAIEAQRKKVLDLKKQRDEISVLAREVETAQRGFDAIGQRMTQSTLEAQSLQTNVAVLTPAFEPLAPAGPKVFLNVLVACVVGLLLAVAVALGLELIQPRIRSAADLARAMSVPVLAALDPAAAPQAEGKWRFWRRLRVQRNRPSVQLKVSEA
ncbi:MAG TPA: chain length determinant protein EpsF [Candidatus Accumulibacter phosphatis]|nr:chain length determinant protein EpsF [Candidatus Accumulibacter phosphatis]HRQ97433.1 chain length determinant protein EpsF [Candidatus Accumulibacter phosphatis]